ncbi:hypothetical protein NLI96_g1437 [Meripilus lineatus]|uniref:Uncharacterized protein n=1 Tax=Meripilus lineatus TaxID=2056292 RepID=A0AAD5VAI1_9APHY|nr:hypothetical protein NLI96_g1437 [Physisporinus lineatus]
MAYYYPPAENHQLRPFLTSPVTPSYSRVSGADEQSYTSYGSSERLIHNLDSTLIVTPLWKDWRTYLLIILALFALCLDAGVLYVTMRTFRLGLDFQLWIGFSLGDKDIITIINIIAKILEGITALIASWALTQLWSRRLCDGKTGAGLAELQSLSIFQSISTMCKVFIHLIRRRFVSMSSLFALLLFAATALQLYSTAIVTLSVPVLQPVPDPPSSYPYVDLPFMSHPAYGTPCNNAAFSPRHSDACLGNLFISHSMSDIINFQFPDTSANLTHPLWQSFTTSYSNNKGTQVESHVGPLNHVDMSEGSILFGQNLATLNSIAMLSQNSTRNATYFSASVNTSLPILTTQCVSLEQSGTVNQLTIAGSTYDLPTPVPLLEDGFAMGQVTSDNMTLILSLQLDESTANVHCAVRFSIRNGEINVEGSPTLTSRQVGGFEDWVGLEALISSGLQPIADFAIVWLTGMGWGSTPSQNGISRFISSAGLTVGTGDTTTTSANFIEYYISAMLASGISLGFPSEQWAEADRTQLNLSLSSRDYSLTKTQYFLGARSALRAGLAFIIAFDMVIIVWCLYIVLSGHRWMPDWTNPAALACTSVCSPPIAACKKSCSGDIKREVWKIRLALDVQDNHLIFRSN